MSPVQNFASQNVPAFGQRMETDFERQIEASLS